MKKKVRIYKAPDGQGQYINKTAQFLKKAATGGGMVDPNAYYNDLIKTAYVSLKSNKDIKDLYESFLGQRMTPEQIKKLLADTYGLMIQNGEINSYNAQVKLSELDSLIEEETNVQQAQQQKSEQEVGADENVEADQAADDDAEQMNQYEQQSMDIATDSSNDEELDDAMEDRSYLEYQYGGDYGGPIIMDEGGEAEDNSNYSQAMMNQFENQKSNSNEEAYIGDIDSLIAETPGMQNITFPGVEDYLYNYQPVSGDESINYLQPFQEQESTEPEFKYGGASSKKSFVKNVMSLLKKAEGGQGDQIEHTPQASQMDDLKGTVKDKKLNFVQSVQNSANEAKIGEMYDQMKSSNNPMTLNEMEQPQARNGMAITPRQYRKIYKAIMRGQKAMGRPQFGYDAKVRLPYSGYAGFYNMFAGMPNPGAISYPDMMRYYTQLQTPVVHSKDLMPNIEVYDTDIFGRPKRYAIGLGKRFRAEDQAKEAELINNVKADIYLPSDNKPDADSEEMPEGYPEADYTYPSSYSDRDAIEEGLPPGMQFGGSMTADTDTLAKFMYGQATDPELAKNVDDPYDEDLTESDIPEARRGRIARGLRNVLVPWNPIFGYAGSWKQQQSLPFYAGTNNPYLGSLQGARPVDTHIDKTTWLRRMPKEWTEYYQIPGSIGSFKPGTMYKGSDGQMHYYNANAGMVENQINNIKQKQDTGYNTDTSGMSGAAKRAIRQGEREMERNAKKVAKNPEGNVPFILNMPDRENNNLGIGTKMKILGSKIMGPKSSEKENLGLGTRLRMFGSKLAGADEYAMGGVPKYGPGGPSLLGSKPAFDQFKSQCPPGSMKDPQTGLCKNFAGEVVPSNQAATAATTFQQNTQGIGTENPMAYSGTNNLTGQDAMHFNAQGTAYENKGVKDLSKEKDKQSELIGARFKAQKMKNFDGEVFDNVLNMGIRGAAGLINRGQQNAIERQMYDEFNSNNIFGSQATKRRGDWVDLGSQLGQFRFDQMGQDRSGFSSYGKYGGQFEDGGEYNMNDDVMVNEPYPYYPESEDVEEPFQVAKEGGEKITYMSEKQIREFLAAGGELEYL